MFLQGLAYGDTLLDACERRLIGHKGVHLGNTLRRTPFTDEFREKMVDTALAADLLSLARTANGEWLLVVAEDDDHVPPVFVAERWLESSSSRVLLVRKRTSVAQFLNLDGLVLEGNWR